MKDKPPTNKGMQHSNCHNVETARGELLHLTAVYAGCIYDVHKVAISTRIP